MTQPSQEPMQLQLTVAALQRLHLDYGSLFKEPKSQLLTLDFLKCLHQLSQGVNDVDKVIALGVHCIN